LNRGSSPRKALLQADFLHQRDLKKFYEENRKSYRSYLSRTRQVSSKQTNSYISCLDRKLKNVYSIKDLKRNLEKEYTDAYGRALKNLFNFMEHEDIEEFNGILPERWNRAVKLRRPGTREIYLSDQELKQAYKKASEDAKPLFKLLVFSGMRASQALEGLKNSQQDIIIKKKTARIPISSISKSNKKAFFIYFPSKFIEELKKFKPIYHYDTYRLRIKHKRVSVSSIRKWNYNFLIENNVPESVADFIQGRSSTTVGSAHYLNKTIHADREYQRIADKLLKLLSNK